MLKCQKDQFQLSEAVTYLNCAYKGPQTRAVAAAGLEAMNTMNEPYKLPIDAFFAPVERLRRAFANLIGAVDYQRIAVIPSVSYGIENVVQNVPLKAGQKVLLATEQFPSNYYPWKRATDAVGATIELISPPKSAVRTTAWNAAILDAIDDSTAVVALGHVHWADGTCFDLDAIRAKTRTVGALLVIDGTQSVGALPFDVARIQPDALICGGYKWLLGPYSLGVAYYGAYFDGGRPIEENWMNRKESENFQQLVNYQPAYRAMAGRYSVGEQSNFILVPMLTAAIEQLLEWQPGRIQTYCKAIAVDAVNELRNLGAELEPEVIRGGHLFGVRLGIAFDLDRLKNLLHERQIYVSLRGDAVRVAPHLYNTTDDLEKLVACFRDVKN